MESGIDYRTRDLGQTQLQLRKDLVITPRPDGDRPGYLVEDPVNSRYFRIGLPEHAFICLLDGSTTVQDALSITARIEPEHTFTEQQAATICRWLIDNRLAATAESTSTRRLLDGHRDQQNSWSQWNPWFLRIPLWHPDRIFARLEPLCSWIFTWPVMLLATMLGVVAVSHVLVAWDRFTLAAHGLLAMDRWLWLGLCWLVIKFVHESAHAIACKRFGGEVREAGVMMVLAAPLAYVDVSSSWRFNSKWQRICTAFAGIYVELIIAALAALTWQFAGTGQLADLCIQVAIMTSVTTLLFNANPLMRFDGYYIASDLLELPNLYTHGQQIVHAAVRRLLWGVSGPLPQLGGGRLTIATVYGVGAAVWRVLVCVGLTVTATRMWHGAGVVLAVVGLVCWVAPSVATQVKFFVSGDTLNRPQRGRCLLVSLALVGTLAATVWYVPWPANFRAPCVVEYAPPAVIHVDSPGFVAKVLVRSGQRVTKDQPLVLLNNQQLKLELVNAELDLQLSTLRMRAALYDGNMTDYQVEREQHASWQAVCDEKAAAVEALTIRAPVAGSVVANDLESMRGQYLDRGFELLTIGDEDHKELHISVDQNDIEAFAANVERPVRVRLYGTVPFTAKLHSVDPRARVELPDRALSAELGGPLAVRPVADTQTPGENHTHYELPTPRLTGTVMLDTERSRTVRAGQRGIVSLGSLKRTIAEHLELRARQWFDTLWRAAPQ